ncbi:hypothetical protein [Paenibacillus sp. J22TS3]|uniref:hypothetical protein n=1 Tax=Paenibacillus sp. J22TS3 TaxID=2807192 RepID=UPI001AFDA42D|nr:hypothetical protein [Paenibacillus sp. J22TS3]GIP20393.1 hypothetical protein J22TS3_06680 [Paenibacillus sp. J22TS3]
MNQTNENRKPGFDEVPDVDPNRPAPTDGLEDVVGAIMDNLEGNSDKSPSKKETNDNNDDTQLV